MREPPDTVVLGCTHFPLLAEELMQVLPEGTRLVDSGAAIARRTAWLISTQENLVSSQEENLAYCMALNEDTDALLPVLQGYGFKSLKNCRFNGVLVKHSTVGKILKIGLRPAENSL